MHVYACTHSSIHRCLRLFAYLHCIFAQPVFRTSNSHVYGHSCASCTHTHTHTHTLTDQVSRADDAAGIRPSPTNAGNTSDRGHNNTTPMKASRPAVAYANHSSAHMTHANSGSSPSNHVDAGGYATRQAPSELANVADVLQPKRQEAKGKVDKRAKVDDLKMKVNGLWEALQVGCLLSAVSICPCCPSAHLS